LKRLISLKIDFICSAIVASAMKAIDLIENDPSLPGRVLANAKYFREEMQGLGFKVFIYSLFFCKN
jgi:hypothetical protein